MDFIKELKELVNKTNAKALHTKLKKLDKNKLIELSSFLPNDSSIGQRVYHLINDIYEIPKCPYCGNNKKLKDLREYSIKGYIHTCELEECKDTYHKEFNLPNNNVKKKYGVDNISQTNYWHEKVKETNLERRGVEWNTQTRKCKEGWKNKWETDKDCILQKRIVTNNEKYNCDYPMQNEEIVEKSKKTMSESEDYQVNRINKIKETNFKNNNGQWFLSTDKFKIMSKSTYLEMYGVEHNSHVPAIVKKRFKYKDYIMPSGKVIKVMGNENLALDILLKEFAEDDIVTDTILMEKHIGKIKYTSTDNKEHRYFPDIYIISERKIIEVKSRYTYECAKDINELKKDACINANFNFEFMIIK